MSDTVVVAQRLQQTALEAERDLRLALEGQLRLYRALLEDIAHRAGLAEHLDALRHDDPTIPKGWGPAQWRAFFEGALPQTQQGKQWGEGKKGASAQELNAARQEIERLRRQVADLQAELKKARRERDKAQARSQKETKKETKPKLAAAPPAASVQPAPPAPSPTQGLYQTWAQMVAELKLPSRSAVPIAQRGLFPANANQRKRQAQILFAVAVLGLSIRPEIDLLVAQANDLKPRSGSVRRLFDDMLQKGLLEAETLRLKSPATRLALVRLGDNGRALAEILFGKPPVENEWERLIRLHEGERFPEHTVAVLLFALHARLRGWKTEIMPSLPDNATPPDIAVEREGQRLFVEVELGKKDRGAKWQNNAAANGGKVALCTGTTQRRALLVGDCKREGLHGVATDLESMIGIPWTKISPDTPLWLEEW